jgi:dihydropteroate synthase
MQLLHAGKYRLNLGRPLIMGIVNLTPDSFSDGGRFPTSQAAVAHALNLREQGADILDIGGESTRPGAMPVDEIEEWHRVEPVLRELVSRDIPVSVDTRKPAIMKAAIEAGAAMINDVEALRAPGAMDAVANSKIAVCLMHMQGSPRTMQGQPYYDDVVGEVRAFLTERVTKCEQAGICSSRILVDPGFGFGKTLAHNIALLKRLDTMNDLGAGLLTGMSRKSMLGELTGRPVDQREYAGIAAHLLAVSKGARVLRVHDVAAMKDALSIWNAVEGGQ